MPERRAFCGPRLILRLCSALRNELPLRIRKALVFVWVPVERVEQNEIENADETCRRETPSPAKMQKQDAEQRHSNGGRKLCHRIKDCRSEAAFLFGKPVADGLGICGERRGFADSQEQPRC